MKNRVRTEINKIKTNHHNLKRARQKKFNKPLLELTIKEKKVNRATTAIVASPLNLTSTLNKKSNALKPYKMD